MKYKIRTLSIALATIMIVAMVGATAVSAANNAAGAATVASSTVGGPITGAPALADDGAAFWNVAQGVATVQGQNIYYETPNLFGGWVAVGTGTNPNVASDGVAGHVWISARGTDGNIWMKKTTDGGTTWTNVALPTSAALAGTGPTAVWRAGEIDVFFVNTARNLVWDQLLPTATSIQTNLGGIVFATPAATTTSTGGIDVVVKGTGGVIYDRLNSLGGFDSWSKFHDGLIGPGASLSSDGAGNLYLLVTGTNNRVYAAWSPDDGVTWLTKFQVGLSLFNTGALYWQNLGGITNYAPSAIAMLDQDFIVRGGDGMIWDGVLTLGVFPISVAWSGPFAGP